MEIVKSAEVANPHYPRSSQNSNSAIEGGFLRRRGGTICGWGQGRLFCKLHRSFHNEGRHDQPLSADEFNAMVRTMCGRYGVLRQAIEEMAESEIGELRRMVRVGRA